MRLEEATKYDIDEYLQEMLAKAQQNTNENAPDAIYVELYDMLFVSFGPNYKQNLQEVIASKFPDFIFHNDYSHTTYYEDCTCFIDAFHEYVEQSRHTDFPTFEDWYKNKDKKK